MKLDQYFGFSKNPPPFMKTDCLEKCMAISSRGPLADRPSEEVNECSLTIGGPEIYIWLTMVAYIATIVFYLSEHVINFIAWARTAKNDSENNETSPDETLIQRTNR